jgi:hypothetical protein
MNNLKKHPSTSLKFMIFDDKNMFEPKVFICVVKMNITNFNSFSFLIINLKIFLKFEKGWCTFDKEKGCFKKKDFASLKLCITFETSSISI